jgi:hypothetical protein
LRGLVLAHDIANTHSTQVVAAKGQAIPSLTGVTLYRFLDAMGDVVDERQFGDHAAALTWAAEGVAEDNEIQRVEFLGPEGDWRWAGPLLG